MAKVVFILNAITITRCHKRIEEFIRNGYDVDVYGFSRGTENYAVPRGYTVNVIGTHDVSMNYFHRVIVIVKSLLRLHKQYKKQDVIFYYFFFDIAFCASLISKRRFIYEDSDIPYANLRHPLLRNYLRNADKKIIRNSLLTVMTSEGFLKYYGLNTKPSNVLIIPNRVNPLLLDLPYIEKQLDWSHLSIGFVGGFRYQSVLNFASVIAEVFPKITFHVFGNIMEFKDELDLLSIQHDNIKLHGVFQNPRDLPMIYEQLDLVLATYDASSVNACYAEPNKMYESIFFRVPIIVSSGTFLSEKVKTLDIGYAINGLDKNAIIDFLNRLTAESIRKKRNNLSLIPRPSVVNSNPQLFNYLEKELK